MVEYYAAEDIYSEDGILLVRKGKKLPKKVIAKLQRYGNFELENLIISNSRLNKTKTANKIILLILLLKPSEHGRMFIVVFI